MKIFINHTNHPSKHWGDAQLGAAREYGEVVDVAFPDIDPGWDTDRVKDMAQETFDMIKVTEPEAVLCHGESVYVYELVKLLKSAGIRALAATTRRAVREETDAEGNTLKQSVFSFVRFREY